MNKTFVIPLLLLTLSCSTEGNQSDSTNEQVNLEQPESLELSVIDESYTLTLQIDELESEDYLLSAKIDFIDSSYVVSPFSEDTIFGKFVVSIEENSNILLESSISELPNSIEEFDPIINQPVRFIRENTTFKKKLKVLSKDDFQVTGEIWFVLEPRCIPEEIKFTISSNSGLLKIEKNEKQIANKK